MFLEKKEQKEAKKGEAKKITPGQLRLQKDLDDFKADPPGGIEVKFPDPLNLMEMQALISVHKESIWGGARFRFRLIFPNNYPMDPPKITLLNKVFHPNLDLNGGVCLPLVREDWLPTYCLTHILLGLLHLFLNPNPRDPLNVDAAELMAKDPELFRRKVRKILEGGMVDGERYEKLI